MLFGVWQFTWSASHCHMIRTCTFSVHLEPVHHNIGCTSILSPVTRCHITPCGTESALPDVMNVCHLTSVAITVVCHLFNTQLSLFQV